jgi:hypothetical protein
MELADRHVVVLAPEEVAGSVVVAIRDERFVIFPIPGGQRMACRASDLAGWFAPEGSLVREARSANQMSEIGAT